MLAGVQRQHVRFPPLADPRKVRFQTVEAEANDRLGWLAVQLLLFK